MKLQRKAKWVIVAVLAMVMTLCISIAAACSTASEVKLTSLGLDTSSVEKDFYVDDEFNYEGLVVTAYYSDESSKVVTDYTVQAPDMTTAGTKSVIVKYQSVQAQYNVTIHANSVAGDGNETYEIGAPIVKYVYDEAAVAVEGATTLDGKDLTLSAKAANGYSVSKVTAKVDGKEVAVKEADGTYTISADALTGNTVITIAAATEGIDEAAYKVNYYSKNGELLATYGYESADEALYQPAAQKYYTFEGWVDENGNKIATISNVEVGEYDFYEDSNLNVDAVKKAIKIGVESADATAVTITIPEDLIVEMVSKNDHLSAIGLILTRSAYIGGNEWLKGKYSGSYAKPWDYEVGKEDWEAIRLGELANDDKTAYSYGYGWGDGYGTLTVKYSISSDKLGVRFFTPWIMVQDQEAPIVCSTTDGGAENKLVEIDSVTIAEVDGKVLLNISGATNSSSLKLLFDGSGAEEYEINDIAIADGGSFNISFALSTLATRGTWYNTTFVFSDGTSHLITLAESKMNDEATFYGDDHIVTVHTWSNEGAGVPPIFSLEISDYENFKVALADAPVTLELEDDTIYYTITADVSANKDLNGSGYWTKYVTLRGDNDTPTLPVAKIERGEKNCKLYFDVSEFTGTLPPHLYVGNKTFDGSDNGDIKGHIPESGDYIWGGKKYYVAEQWEMPVLHADKLSINESIETITLTTDADNVYLVINGTLKSEDELESKLKDIHFDLQVNGFNGGSWIDGEWTTYEDFARTVTVNENGNWTLKFNITNLNIYWGYTAHFGSGNLELKDTSNNGYSVELNAKRYTIVNYNGSVDWNWGDGAGHFYGAIGIKVEDASTPTFTAMSASIEIDGDKAAYVVKSKYTKGTLKTDDEVIDWIKGIMLDLQDNPYMQYGNWDVDQWDNHAFYAYDVVLGEENGVLIFTAKYDITNLEVFCYTSHYGGSDSKYDFKPEMDNYNESITVGNKKYTMIYVYGGDANNYYGCVGIRVENV